ncbi:MAG: N-acylhomoserine lactonase, partial [Nocardioidaceae bacterium]|nr:N-acylhomoserine lactonase [Nocardioidaceae bacterium]
KEEGVDLEKVVIGHCGDSTDADYLCKVADAGSMLGMDRFGADMSTPFEDRVNIVVEMARRGYAEKMVLAHDYACCQFMFKPEAVRALMPRFSLTHISHDVIPALLERGVTEAQVESMLVDNPMRHFS